MPPPSSPAPAHFHHHGHGGVPPSSPARFGTTNNGFMSPPPSSVSSGSGLSSSRSPSQTPITAAMEASQWLYQIRSMPGGAGSAADPQEKISKYLEQVPEESREGLRSDMNERVKVRGVA